MSDPSTYCVPFVAAIIERTTPKGVEFLIQTRMNTKHQSIYNGTLEFAAGTLDRHYENVYEAMKREVYEETGMTVKFFISDSQTKIHALQNDGAFGFRPYCCTQQLKEGRPWVGFIFRCEVEDGTPVGQEGESTHVLWMPKAELYSIYKNTPEKLFTLELPAWDYYFQENPV